MSKPNDMPLTPLSRGMVSATTLAKAGGKSLKFMAKKPFLGSDKKAQAKADSEEDIAQEIFKGLSKLRGTALKLAQMLSLEGDMIPEQYRKQLNRSHYKVPPLNRALVRQVVENEFGKPIEEVFAEFDLQAFAAASLGQVHHAKLRDGTAVAVKVQYPGIEEAIASDIKLVRHLLGPVITRFTSKNYFDRALTEVAERLKDEADYVLEAEKTMHFREKNQVADVVIPQTYPGYSGKTVLTTEFIAGLHVDEWLELKPEQELIDRAAQAMFDFHTSNIFANACIHGDPNPGNYLFLEDGRVAVIDFGCFKEFSQDDIDMIRHMMLAIVDQDYDAIRTGYAKMGFVVDSEEKQKYYDETLFQYTLIFNTPHRYDEFDFKVHTNFTSELADMMANIATNRLVLDNFTTNTIFIDRTFYGIYRIFDQLGAKVRYGNQWTSPEKARKGAK